MPLNSNNGGRYNQQQVNYDNNAQVQPQATDIERIVLGAQMIDKDANALVVKIIKNDPVYYEARNQMVQDAIDTLVRDGHPISPYTVAEQLSRMGKLEDVGGPGYVTELSARVASSADIEYYACVLLESYGNRQFIQFAESQRNKGFDRTITFENKLIEADTALQSMRNILPDKEIKDSKAIIKEAVEEIQAAASNPDGITGIASFTSLDAKTAGFQNSDLIIVAARPAMGKTSFALTIIKKIAVIQKIPSAFFSLEMSAVQLTKRLISDVASISGQTILRGQLSCDEWDRLDKSLTPLIDAPLYIDDTPGLTIGEFRSKAKRLVKEKEVKIIFVDYLQLMHYGAKNFSTRQEEVSNICESLKNIAKELNVPIIALAQLNRGVENREGLDGKRPRLSDLRESGSIEQAADLVMFIHRPEYYHIYQDENGRDLRGMAQIIIAKHRKGATGDVLLSFRGEFTRFEDPEENNLNSPHQSTQEPVAEPVDNETTYQEGGPTPF